MCRVTFAFVVVVHCCSFIYLFIFFTIAMDRRRRQRIVINNADIAVHDVVNAVLILLCTSLLTTLCSLLPSPRHRDNLFIVVQFLATNKLVGQLILFYILALLIQIFRCSPVHRWIICQRCGANVGKCSHRKIV